MPVSEAPKFTMRDSAQRASRGGRIRTPKTSEVVADQIRGRIVRGELAEGATLPPEGQLMETLGISRPTLREALRILEAEDLISVVRGSRSGATVHAPRVELASRYFGHVLQAESTTIADLYEARLAIESYVVRALCARGAKAAVKRLRDEIAKLKAQADEQPVEDFAIVVAEFHRLLVEVAGNKTLTFLNHLLLDLLARHQVEHIHRHSADPAERHRELERGMRSYEKLLVLIEAKDEDAAVAHWRLHLKNANAKWAGAGEGERIVNSLGT